MWGWNCFGAGAVTAACFWQEGYAFCCWASWAGKSPGYLFFPGCQLSAFAPETVKKAWEFMRGEFDAGIMLGCCGAPAVWAGDLDRNAKNIDLIRENFDKCAVSPDFKIGDEAAINVLAKQVVTELVNEYLEKDSALFRGILDLTDSEFDESNFVDTAKEIFKVNEENSFTNNSSLLCIHRFCLHLFYH